jgi:hypothetical protein
VWRKKGEIGSPRAEASSDGGIPHLTLQLRFKQQPHPLSQILEDILETCTFDKHVLRCVLSVRVKAEKAPVDVLGVGLNDVHDGRRTLMAFATNIEAANIIANNAETEEANTYSGRPLHCDIIAYQGERCLTTLPRPAEPTIQPEHGVSRSDRTQCHSNTWCILPGWIRV